MQETVNPGRVSGSVLAPSSKSILQRYMIAAMLARGTTRLSNVTLCLDTRACWAGILNFGADASSQTLSHIKGRGKHTSSSTGHIHCGESGFALRVFAPIAALSDEITFLHGEWSLIKRPVDFFEKVFPQLGVQCESQNGFLPLKIQGPIQFKDITIDGSLSSQFLSGLLMVYPLAKKDHIITVKNLRSKQYIDLTIQVLKDFGITITHDSYQKFFIPGDQKYKACTADIEGDWSAASFLLVAGATAGEVTVNNLSLNSLQPDKAIIEVLKKCGANIIQKKNSITVTDLKHQTLNLKPFKFDATDCPDLFPPLVALAAQCKGASEIKGVQRLIHKESNRALALQTEFNKLNKELISIEGNKMIIKGGLKLQSAEVDSHNDHRIAMALAIAALNVQGGIKIKGSEAVKKSYPDFFSDLDKLKIKKIQ